MRRTLQQVRPKVRLVDTKKAALAASSGCRNRRRITDWGENLNTLANKEKIFVALLPAILYLAK
jgi:hypothetical protein